ncbi:MAG TPA: hypothetical protein VJM50_21205 [Pyrinomonadaceae bacterium]|nr:hypothetical protein [Pyrinomonadaceae bacterium]
MQNGNNETAVNDKIDAADQYTKAFGYVHMQSLGSYLDANNDLNKAFMAGWDAGAAWQKERAQIMQAESQPVGLMLSDMHNATCEGFSEMGDALDRIAEGFAEMLARQQSTMATLDTMGGNIALIMKQNGDHGGIVGKIWANSKAAIDQVQARLEEVYAVGKANAAHLNDQDAMLVTLEGQANRLAKDIGEKIEGLHPRFDLLGGRISRKTMEVTAAILPVLKDVGQKVEAVGFMVADEVEVSGITEPMHADVKAEPVDASGLGKMWRDVPVDLADVSDETLHMLLASGQISEGRYLEENDRRAKARYKGMAGEDLDAPSGTYQLDRGTLHVGVDLAKDAAGEDFKVETAKGTVLVEWKGGLFRLNGVDLIPMRVKA